MQQLVIEVFINGRRDKIRQRKTCGDDIKIWTKCSNLGEVKKRAQDKVCWRGLVLNLRIENETYDDDDESYNINFAAMKSCKSATLHTAH